jgi:DNA-binding NtrC family response regulator
MRPQQGDRLGCASFDEIANMPLEIQAKLLRVIQEQEVVRLGSEKPIALKFRVICATNRDLEQMARDGTFKEDLLQRISAIPVHVPPLRERREDIASLARHFARQQGRADLSFASDAMSALIAYRWPGNVRELQNMITYVSTMVETAEITLADLPPKIRQAARLGEVAPGTEPGFYEQIAEFERGILRAAYAGTQGNISRLAQKLRMDRSHLYTKLRELGIHQPSR